MNFNETKITENELQTSPAYHERITVFSKFIKIIMRLRPSNFLLSQIFANLNAKVVLNLRFPWRDEFPKLKN